MMARGRKARRSANPKRSPEEDVRFRQWLGWLRLRAALTLSQLADQSGLATDTVRRFENGQLDPTAQYVDQLLKLGHASQLERYEVKRLLAGKPEDELATMAQLAEVQLFVNLIWRAVEEQRTEVRAAVLGLTRSELGEVPPWVPGYAELRKRVASGEESIQLLPKLLGFVQTMRAPSEVAPTNALAVAVQTVLVEAAELASREPADPETMGQLSQLLISAKHHPEDILGRFDGILIHASVNHAHWIPVGITLSSSEDHCRDQGDLDTASQQTNRLLVVDLPEAGAGEIEVLWRPDLSPREDPPALIQ